MKRTILIILSSIFIGLTICFMPTIFGKLCSSNCDECIEDSVIIFSERSARIEEIKSLSPEEGLGDAIEYYGISNPSIVIAQSIVETGNFTSKLCIEGNNLFGLYDTKNCKYFKYDHWIESVEAYKRLIQRKYKGGDYYQFLEDIVYAQDENYIDRVREIAEEIDAFD